MKLMLGHYRYVKFITRGSATRIKFEGETQILGELILKISKQVKEQLYHQIRTNQFCVVKLRFKKFITFLRTIFKTIYYAGGP
jgi:hypothetical protein